MVEDRIAALESRAETLERRVRQLEGTDAPVWAAPPPPPPAMPMPPLTRHPRITPSPPPGPKRPERDIEDFLGGNVLAWVGGLAVLAGLAFLLTMAISR